MCKLVYILHLYGKVKYYINVHGDQWQPWRSGGLVVSMLDF